jgi:hypothetical protein
MLVGLWVVRVMLFAPILHIETLEKSDCDRALIAWNHKMGGLITLSEHISVKVLSSGMMAGKTDDEIKKAIEIFLNPVAGTHSHGRPIYANEASSCGIKVETLDVNSVLWRKLYELYARTEMFVSIQASKAIESREESFYAGTSN